MAITTAPSLSADVRQYLAEDLLPLTISELVAYDFGDKVMLPRHNGTTYTMTRYHRLPLASAPTAEGVPPVATPLTISQATVALQQWTALVTVTDVAQLTIKHDVFEIAKDRLKLSGKELLERNTFQALSGFTQINYVNSRGSRGALVAGDVLNTQELQRAFAVLQTLGTPMFKGPEGPIDRKKAEEGQPNALSNPRSMPHYVGMMHPLVQGDLRDNPNVQLVSAYTSPNRLYNGEFGEWNQIRFVSSNMVPFFTGIAQATGIGSTTGGTLVAGDYQIIITGSDSIYQYEQLISQQSANINVSAGSTGSIDVTVPSTAGFTYSVYISAAGSTTVANLATSAAGPTQGSLQGMAVQIAPGASITLTGIGTPKVPPAAPANGLTVYPTWIFGKGAYCIVTLEDFEVYYVDGPERVDPANQTKMASFKFYNGTFIKNNTFAMRIEGTSKFSLTFG
ncbi:MAG: N4-gp56 family major capsid protein [Nitrososphaera sp.]|nr:N4-gp56 family major capsid protein [Nitrososphaera sp.]